MKIKVGLFGASGKMGKAVQQMLEQHSSDQALSPFLSIGTSSDDFFAINAEKIENIETEVLADVDVWIDFSSPEGLMNLLKTTEKNKTPVVSGSTGITEEQFKQLKKFAKTRKIFWASNMSPGLWAFRQAMKSLSLISNFDFAIEEIHHTQKKDKPSGTAKTLHADLEKIVSKKLERPISYRLGGVFGIHKIFAASSNEIITLEHQALNRTVFAEGAILAAKWLVEQKPGYYSMDDLFLKSKREEEI